MGKFWIILAGLWVAIAVGQGAHLASAQTPAKLTILTKPIAPFVMRSDGKLVGFSIDLWDELAARTGFATHYEYVDTLKELLDGIQQNKADLAIAAVTITKAREADADFSHSYFHSGLQVMVANEESNIGTVVWATIKSIISSSTFLYGVGIFLGFVFFAANIFWLLERRHNSQISKSYFVGVWDAFWWSLVTVSTVGYGDTVPKTHGGRLMSVIWIIFGYLGFAWFTAVVTSTVTVSQLTGSIGGPDSLGGRMVATATSSTSAHWLRQNVPSAKLLEYKNINGAYDALIAGKVDAVVYDAPSLLYFSNNQGKGEVHTVGSVFHKEEYGMIFPNQSPIREKINLALLELFEDGTHAQLMEKWFGIDEVK